MNGICSLVYNLVCDFVCDLIGYEQFVSFEPAVIGLSSDLDPQHIFKCFDLYHDRISGCYHLFDFRTKQCENSGDTSSGFR